MAQPRVIEVDYYILVEKIKRARDANCLVERTSNKEVWAEYVAEHNIRETSLEAFGKVKFISGKPRLIGITMGTNWDGCYAYSIDDESALKYIPAS